jgi:hypothetical protein
VKGVFYLGILFGVWRTFFRRQFRKVWVAITYVRVDVFGPVCRHSMPTYRPS